MSNGHLYYGDNLDVLREHVQTESVDLVYLDPPFNSNRNYNVIFARRDIEPDANRAQIQAFDDTWRWTPITDEQYRYAVAGGLPSRVADALSAMRTLLGENDAMAYLMNMAPRLVELHRALKRTGSLFLHCDPTMSHYLKVLLDAIFGAANFKSEIIWKRTTAHNSARRYGPVHDVILFYVREAKNFTWNAQHQQHSDQHIATKYNNVEASTGKRYRLTDMTGPGVRQGDSGKQWRGFDPTGIGRHWQPPSYCYWKYEQITGQDLAILPFIDRLDELDRVGLIYWPAKPGGKPRHKGYLEDTAGTPLQDVWTDIDPINARAAERLGYPTQKPIKLLERILSASTNEGDVVLDPFCGCGTTIDAAVKLGREWIGIDVTYLSVDLIQKRLLHTYGAEIVKTYEVRGIPRDLAGARALFKRSPFEFERWAVSLVNGTPNQKQVGDRGIDGVVRFYTDTQYRTGRVLVSVKGGKTIGPQYVRDLIGTVGTERAEMGTLLTLAPATRGIEDALNRAGNYHWPVNGQAFPVAQALTVDDLMTGRRQFNAPPSVNPYIAADRRRQPFEQLILGVG